MYFLRKKPFDLRGPSNTYFFFFGWGQMPFPLWVSLRKWRSASMIKRGTAGVSHMPPLLVPRGVWNKESLADILVEAVSGSMGFGKI